MKRCLIDEGSFKRMDLSKKLGYIGAELGRSRFVPVALFILLSIVGADANALQGSAAKLSAIDQQQSQQTIATLTETVGNLSQQLSRRDQKIEVLEKQIDELKSDIGGDVLAGSIALVPAQPFSSSETKNLSTSAPVAKQTVALWQWALLCFFALSLSAYLLRARLYTKTQWLKLFGSTNSGSTNSGSKAVSNDQFESDNFLRQSFADDFIADAFDANSANQEIPESISHDLADVGYYKANDTLTFEAYTAIDDIEDLSFEQRFEQLLAEKDFAFARELLDFTRYNEINDERYHCERLRLLEKMRDEDGFYAYYYGIESKIPSFPENLQTQISQLVVMLAHR